MKMQNFSKRITLFTDDLSRHENVVVIWTSEGPVLVDAFRSPAQFAIVQKYLADRGYTKPYMQIFTHWHANHTLGNQDLKGVRIVSHQLTLEFMQNTLPKIIREQDWGCSEYSFDEIKIFTPTEIYRIEKHLEIGDTTIVLIHAPGHSPDSTLVFLPDQQALFAGDNLVGPEVEFFFPPIFPQEETGRLEALAQVYRQIRLQAPKTVIPGHGWVLPPDEMLALNEHRYKFVLKRAIDIMDRSLPSLSSYESSYAEQVIRAWLSQANTCITMNEQEALKENIGRVLHLFSQTFDKVVINNS
ncbi:MAG: MBL fold metallo-hydrolase [Desulfitobacteriaceae bacterium]